MTHHTFWFIWYGSCARAAHELATGIDLDEGNTCSGKKFRCGLDLKNMSFENALSWFLHGSTISFNKYTYHVGSHTTKHWHSGLFEEEEEEEPVEVLQVDQQRVIWSIWGLWNEDLHPSEIQHVTCLSRVSKAQHTKIVWYCMDIEVYQLYVPKPSRQQP